MLRKHGLLWGAVLAVSLLPTSWGQVQAADKDKAPRGEAQRQIAQPQIKDKTDRVDEAADEAKRQTDDARNLGRDAAGEPQDQRNRDASIVRPPRAADRRPDFGASFDVQDNRLRFSDIARDSIAAHAGLRQGDVLLSVNGQRIDSRAAFDRYLYNSRVARVPIVVLRGNERHTVYVDSGQFVRDGRRFADRVVADRAWLGVFPDYDQPDRAMLRGIEPNSPADRAGLRAGDTIVRVNDDEVRSPEDLNRLIGARRPGEQVELTLGGQARDSITVTLGSRPAPDRAIHVPAPFGVDVNVNPGRGVEVDVSPRGGVDVDIYRDRRSDRRGRR